MHLCLSIYCYDTLHLGDTSFKPVGGNSRNVHDNQVEIIKITIGRMKLWPFVRANTPNLALVSLPKLNQSTCSSCNSKFIHRSFCHISSRIWDYLPDRVRRASSIGFFKNLLRKVNLTIDAQCCCNLCISR